MQDKISPMRAGGEYFCNAKVHVVGLGEILSSKNFQLSSIYALAIRTCMHTPSILPELQGVFGHLLESKLQYYSPENFWKKFKLWGQPVNVREQQDAFDFFCNLTDQVDERLKVRDTRA